MNNFFIDEYDAEAVNKKLMRSLKSEGYREGITEGKSLGKKEQQIEIAKKMLNDNLNINLIATYTGLTNEELENLK